MARKGLYANIHLVVKCEKRKGAQKQKFFKKAKKR